MTKQELTQIIKKNAKKQCQIYQEESKGGDIKMEYKFKGAVRGIKEFIKNLQALKIIN